jgi:uncharacterized protein with PIN domain
MTLREFLNRRIHRAVICSAIAVVVVWAFTIRAPKGSPENYLMGVAFLVGIFAVLFVSSRARCPRCREAIGYIDTSEMRKHRKRILDAGLDRCRNCGLHLDERIPPSK